MLKLIVELVCVAVAAVGLASDRILSASPGAAVAVGVLGVVACEVRE